MTKLQTLNMVELSTAHLHPLEAEKMKEVSYFDNDSSNLVPTIDEFLSDCKRLYMVCLHDLLVELRERERERESFVYEILIQQSTP